MIFIGYIRCAITKNLKCIPIFASLILHPLSQHTSLVGSYSRKSLNQGVNQSIAWHPSGSRIAITVLLAKFCSFFSFSIFFSWTLFQTSEGYLLFYSIEVAPASSLDEVQIGNGRESSLTYLPIRLPPKVKISFIEALHVGASRINW